MPTPLTKEEIQLVVDFFTQKALTELYVHQNTLSEKEAQHLGAEPSNLTPDEIKDMWEDTFTPLKDKE